jgi:hypothetical protein
MPLLLLIMAAGLPTPGEARYPEAVEVFHCTFDGSRDVDFDGWPDGWTRRRGPGFPHYVSIKISEDGQPPGNRCLQVELNGGAATAYSPPILITPQASYVLEGYLKTEGLQHDRAYYSVTLLDGDRQRLQTHCSQQVPAAQGWQKVRLGPLVPGGSNACSAVIGLHVEPQSGEDYRGTVLFADIWLGRLPRLTLETSDRHNFFTDPQAVEIGCTVAGVAQHDPEVTLQLEDALGLKLAEVRQRLSTQANETRGEASPESAVGESPGRIDTARWKPPIPGPGFYRVRAWLQGRQSPVCNQELTLAVVEPCQAPRHSEFGWSLPQGDKPLPLPVLGRLIGQAGVGWVKYPCWSAQAPTAAAVDQLAAFAERLGGQGVQLVGLLSVPPASRQAQPGSSGPSPAAEVFTRPPKDWYPSLEPVLTRLGTQIRWWQLGHDKDTSFAGHPDLARKIGQVKSELDRIGQDVNVGLGWSWLSPPPPADKNNPWRFLSLSAEPPGTAAELAAHLGAWKDANFHRWVVVEALRRDSSSSEARAADLVERMIAAKVHGAQAAFCPDPFSPACGLMNPDGTPGELFLPWRTAALALGGGKHLGSIALPGGSPNHVFARGQDAVMVVWNDKPTEESLYLGESIVQTDVWGRRVTPAAAEGRQVIRVGPLPVFVSGLSEPLARWLIDFKFARDQIPSIFGRPHENAFCVRNPFADAVSGRATLVGPDGWKIAPSEIDFRLAAGEQWQQPVKITLPYNAESGRQRLRVDFEIRRGHGGEQACRFSVYRYVEVGLGDVYVEISTRLGPQGNLEVVQRFVNQGDHRVSFLCELYAPDRRRLTTHIIRLGRAEDVQIYSLPDGQQLLGKTLWLCAGEKDGLRTFSYRFVAKN